MDGDFEGLAGAGFECRSPDGPLWVSDDCGYWSRSPIDEVSIDERGRTGETSRFDRYRGCLARS